MASLVVLAPGVEMQLNIPHHRPGSFGPKLVAKHQRHIPGYDAHVINIYTRSMWVLEIQAYLLEPYGTEVSTDLISTITAEMLDAGGQWQQRALERMFPIVYFDALRLKIHDEDTVKHKAIYHALGVHAGGRKEVLGLGIEQMDDAKFLLKVFNERKNPACKRPFVPQLGCCAGARKHVGADRR